MIWGYHYFRKHPYGSIYALKPWSGTSFLRGKAVGLSRPPSSQTHPATPPPSVLHPLQLPPPGPFLFHPLLLDPPLRRLPILLVLFLLPPLPPLLPPLNPLFPPLLLPQLLHPLSPSHHDAKEPKCCGCKQSVLWPSAVPTTLSLTRGCYVLNGIRVCHNHLKFHPKK